jgi:butyrate kinase
MAEKQFRILAINPGSSSTKLAVYENEHLVFESVIRHSDSELSIFRTQPVVTQLDFRLQTILALLKENHLEPRDFAAIVGRGGLLKPLASGTYRVDPVMLLDLQVARRGEHASNLGAFLAQRLAEQADIPAYIVDPVSVDEWPEVARLSGLAGLERECLSHALNSKAVVKRFVSESKIPYTAARVIVAHLGSGFSISAHRDGRMIDATNSMQEGAFSTERAGSLPVMKLLDLCFREDVSKTEVKKMIFGEGGVYSYLQTRDFTEVIARRDRGETKAMLVFDALVYQISKEVGAMAAVLSGQVQAILLTGGLAYSTDLVETLKQRIAWIAEVYCFPGEDELLALAQGGLRVLKGEEPEKKYG